MKTGFIYIWHDSKRKMYYIGCHWGAEDDGYICSSVRMKDAYKQRPQDFNRRILTRKIPTREMLLEEELRWLSHIKEEELGKRYYNYTNRKIGSSNSWNARSEKMKQNLRDWHKTNPNHNKSEERARKISEAKTGVKLSEDHIANMSKSKKGIKVSKGIIWTIKGPDGTIYQEDGMDTFAKENSLCANNLRTRGHSKGYILINKMKKGIA